MTDEISIKIAHFGPPCVPPVVEGVTFEHTEAGIWVGLAGSQDQVDRLLRLPTFSLVAGASGDSDQGEDESEDEGQKSTDDVPPAYADVDALTSKAAADAFAAKLGLELKSEKLVEKRAEIKAALEAIRLAAGTTDPDSK